MLLFLIDFYRERKGEGERDKCQPTNWVCALTGNQTSDFSDHGMMLITN
jgi:hypothetical protein